MPPMTCTRATGSSLEASTTWVAPNSSAHVSFWGMTSTAMILPAPTRRAAWIVLSPTPPQPNTATLAPGGTLAPLSDSRLLGRNDTVQATRARGGRDALRPADQGRDGRRRDGLRALSR